jgi:23S rRNA (adenine2030-N6)-methyltransferase
LYGDGVFEGIRAYSRLVFKLKEHVTRLYETAHTLMIKIPLSKKEMEKAIVETLKVNQLHDAYIRVIRSVNGSEEKLKNYPGSPFFARFYLGKNDRLRLSELHPEDIKALNGFFEKDPRIKVFFQDGYQSLKALLPPPERRGIVLIDPPFERRDEFKVIIEGLKEAQKRFAHGIYAIWYPLKEMKIVDQFYKELSCLGFGNILRLEMTIHREPQEEGLKGCGMTILNPPWQLEEKMKKVLPRFLDYLNAKGTIVINNQKNSPS